MTDRVIHSDLVDGNAPVRFTLLHQTAVAFPVAIKEQGGGIRNLLSQEEGETMGSRVSIAFP